MQREFGNALGQKDEKFGPKFGQMDRQIESLRKEIMSIREKLKNPSDISPIGTA